MKMAVLLITHDLGIIAENARRVAIMYAGRLMELVDVKELFHNPRHPYTMGLLESLPKEKGTPLVPIPGFVPEPYKLPPGCKFSDRCRFAIPACSEKEPELRSLSVTSNKLRVTRKDQNADSSLVTCHSLLHLVRCIRSEEIRWQS
jgi:oligopeptide/dipeptide ABC transporter ATP-binding protein